MVIKMFEKLKNIFTKKEAAPVKPLTKVEIRALNRKNPQGIKDHKYKRPTQKLTKNMKTALENPKKKGL